MIRSARELACFVPNDAIDAVTEILPGTPRRLKGIARGLSLLSDSIPRYGNEELNWPAILFATIIRQEHEQFSDLLLDQIAEGENPYASIFKKADEELERRTPAQMKSHAMTRTILKLMRDGKYLAEIPVELIKDETTWSPYLSPEDVRKLDTVRLALRRGDIAEAAKHGRVFELTSIAAK